MKTRRIPQRISLLLKALGITTLAYLLSQLLISPYTASLSALFSTNDKTDFRVSDLFMQVADNRPVRLLEDNFVMLDIGRCDREEIAEVLSVLSLCGPRLVALDINFAAPGDNDSILMESLSSVPDLVLPLGLKQNGDKFSISEKPFFYEEKPEFRYGAVNFPSSRSGGTVRDYAVSFPLDNGEELPSFAMAIADIADPAKAREIRERGADSEAIAYHSKELTIIPYEELIDRAEEFTEKIVLVGSTTEASDIHSIPIRRGVSGMEIHAYALSTILQGEYLKNMPGAIDTLTAIVICFLIVLGAISIKNGVRGLVLRIAQLSALYIIVRIGYGLLVDKDTVADFSQSILMITFGLLSVDLWNGTAALIKSYYEKKEKKDMKKLLAIILLISGIFVMNANYSVYGVTGDVKIESGGKIVPAVKGMQLKASDCVVIPRGGKVEIHNKLSKRIYTSIKEGKITVSRLMIEAKGVAEDNERNVRGQVRFGKKEEGGKVYEDIGMVRRSLAVYDPEGDGVEMNATTLGGFLAGVIKSGSIPELSAEEVGMVTDTSATGGTGFRFENKLSFPVYFNVIKIAEDGKTIEISRLGQPAGSYVVLPGQTLSRHDQQGISPEDRQLLVMTHCQYDVDKVIEEIISALDSPAAEAQNLPVSIVELR